MKPTKKDQRPLTEMKQAQGQDKQRAKLEKIRKDFCTTYEAWIEDAKNANSYLRGVHNVNGTYTKSNPKALPEDKRGGSDDKLYPSIPYALSILDRMVKYIRHDEGEILVTAEGKYGYPNVDPRLLQVMPDIDAELSESEIIAKMLTARIDLYSERSNVERLMREAAQTAGSQRMAFVIVEWDDDETSEEPVRARLVPAGSYWFDDEASGIDDARYIGYQENVDKKEAEKYYGQKITVESSRLDVYHHFVRDYTEDDEQGDASDEQADGVVYKYPSAWRYTITTDKDTLYDGPLKTPGGRPPIVTMTWRPLPRSMIGVSVLDSTRTINNNIDRTVQYIMQHTYRALPKIAVDTNLVEDPDQLNSNEVDAFLFYDSTKGAGPGYNYIAGGAVPESLYTLLDTLKSLGAEMTGADGIEMEDASKFKLSGDAIEGLAADREGVASGVRDDWYLFRMEFFELVLRFIMQYENRDVSLTVETPAGPVNFVTNIKAYDFEDSEFDARFDVSVFSPKNMPKNPVRRAQYMLELLNTVASLAQADPELARLYIDLADLPNKQSLLAYLDSKTQEAEMAGAEQPQADAEAIKIRERMATDVAKSVSDGLESVAKEAAGTGQYELAAQILASIPMEANNAYQQVITGTTSEPRMQDQMQLPIEESMQTQPMVEVTQ